MNCKEFEKLVLTLARTPELDRATGEQGLAHKEICARCAKRLAEEQTLLVGVQTVIDELANEEAPAHLEAALLAAFRKQATADVSATIIPMPVRNKDWQRWTLGAIAAGILILFSTAFIFWEQSHALNQKRGDQGSLQPPDLPPPANAPQVVGRQDADPPPASPHPRKRVRHQAPVAKPEAEEVTEFYSLMDDEDLSAVESGQIVRVELPGLALIDMGLPVDAALANESVKADVLLRHDGLACAIRFVR